MRKGLKLGLSGALCSAMLATAIPTEVVAGPMSVPDPATLSPSSPVENVWYRRGWGYRRGYYNPGGAIAAGVGLGLLGAGLAASTGGGYYGGYYPYYGGYGYYPGYYYGGYYPYYGGWGW